jgi:two-component system LytT family response regulator
MTRLRVLTVDDEPLARERVSSLVREHGDLELVGEAANGLEALDLISSSQPDLVFIDVEMPELSGFGVIAALDAGKIPGVVFITAYEHYAMKAFEIGAIDYLPKPVVKSRFEEAVSRARLRLEKSGTQTGRSVVQSASEAEKERGFRARFVVKRGATHYFVPVEEVEWIDVADNYLRLHAGDRAHLWRGTMKDAEEQLDPRKFVRVHRSAMVAIDRIVSVNASDAGHVIELRSGMKLRGSRQYAEQVRGLLQ